MITLTEANEHILKSQLATRGRRRSNPMGPPPRPHRLPSLIQRSSVSRCRHDRPTPALGVTPSLYHFEPYDPNIRSGWFDEVTFHLTPAQLSDTDHPEEEP